MTDFFGFRRTINNLFCSILLYYYYNLCILFIYVFTIYSAWTMILSRQISCLDCLLPVTFIKFVSCIFEKKLLIFIFIFAQFVQFKWEPARTYYKTYYRTYYKNNYGETVKTQDSVNKKHFNYYIRRFPFKFYFYKHREWNTISIFLIDVFTDTFREKRYF